MAESTSIGWTRSTWNPWIGCTKVSPACDHCYAERMDARGIFGGATHWGPGVPRYRTSASNWNTVRRWNKAAAAAGEFWPVFTASQADIFDNEVPDAWREEFWQTIRECPHLTFQIVTKRIGNAPRMLPADWGKGYLNVWLIATVATQAEADRDISKLLRIPAILHGLSMEPLLEAVVIDPAMLSALKWVIVGGESGPGCRDMDLAWPRHLLGQCAAAGVCFYMKQLGGA
jgi:protein gp37